MDGDERMDEDGSGGDGRSSSAGAPGDSWSDSASEMDASEVSQP